MRQASSIEIGTVATGPVSRQAQADLVVSTRGPGFVEITDAVRQLVRASGIGTGLAILFCRHTSASLTIQENADPDVLADLGHALDVLAPRDRPYIHGAEGPDDMPAHIRTMLMGTSLSVPVRDGEPTLGRWQGLFLVEHRDRPHVRTVSVTMLGS